MLLLLLVASTFAQSRMLVQASNASTYGTAKTAVESGTVFGVSVDLVLSHDGKRLLYIETATLADLVTLYREIQTRSAYTHVYHRASVPSLSELFESDNGTTLDAYAAGYAAGEATCSP